MSRRVISRATSFENTKTNLVESPGVHRLEESFPNGERIALTIAKSDVDVVFTSGKSGEADELKELVSYLESLEHVSHRRLSELVLQAAIDISSVREWIDYIRHYVNPEVEKSRTPTALQFTQRFNIDRFVRQVVDLEVSPSDSVLKVEESFPTLSQQDLSSISVYVEAILKVLSPDNSSAWGVSEASAEAYRSAYPSENYRP